MIKNVVITGHHGFVGGYLHEALVKGGYNVYGLDLPEADILKMDSDYFNRFDCKIDAIIHLAAYKGLKDCFNNPRKALEVNTVGTLNLLEAAVNSRSRFV